MEATTTRPCPDCGRRMGYTRRGLCHTCGRRRFLPPRPPKPPRPPRPLPPLDPSRPACRACGVRNANKCRQLCWGCYYRPGVRDRFPPLPGKFNNRGVPDGNGARPLPASPTAALPGSPEKVAVLEERARVRQSLWHPADAGGVFPGVPALTPEPGRQRHPRRLHGVAG